MEKLGTWELEQATEYFFDGGDPHVRQLLRSFSYLLEPVQSSCKVLPTCKTTCEKILKAWELRGQRVEKVEPVLEKAMTDKYGNEKRGLKGNKHVTYVIARK